MVARKDSRTGWIAAFVGAVSGLVAFAFMRSDKPAEATEPGAKGKARKATDAMLDAFDFRLAAAGVRDFSARDLTANKDKKGKRIHLMPPVEWEQNLIDVAVLAQSVRDAWGDELVVSSAYRPQDGKKSRHHDAKAIDLDLPPGKRSTKNRDALYLMMARRYLTSKKNGRTGFGGMGFYTQPKGRLHIDVRDRPAYWSAKIVKPFFSRARSA